jgi:quinol monooxygenase YgiN
MNMQSKAVTVVITCEIKSDKIEMARRELSAVIELVLANEPACFGIRVHDDPKNPQRLLIIEHWESEEVFTGPHMQMPYMKAFLETAREFLQDAADFGFWREITSSAR